MKSSSPLKIALTAAALSLSAGSAAAQSGSVIANPSLCAGEGCGASTSSPPVTIRSANPRIDFVDTDRRAGLWRIETNTFFSNFFSIEEFTDARTQPFAIEGGAPTAALWVASDGDIGLGTGLPQQDLHVRSGNLPVLRLEQDGSTGATPQTWDIGGGSGDFFLRDITNNVVPFKVLPGTGNTGALTIAESGNIGLGTDAPQAKLHVQGQSMLIQDAGRVNFTLSDTSDPGPDFRTQLSGGSARFSFVGSGQIEMKLSQGGDLEIAGNYLSSGTQLNVPDYVFDEDYALRPLAEVQDFIDTHSHLPEVPSAAEIATDGLDMSAMQMTLLKKIEELTLYTLAQEARMAAQERAMADQTRAMAGLRADMAALKAARH